MPDVDIANIGDIRADLKRLVHDNDSQGILDDNAGIPTLPLYLLSDVMSMHELTRARGSDEAAPLKVFALRLTFMLRPQTMVFLQCDGNSIAAGTTIEAMLEPVLPNVYSDASMSMLLKQRGFRSVHLFRIKYEYVSLCQFRIVSVEPMDKEWG